MDSIKFQYLLESVIRLSLGQRRLLERALQEASSTDEALEVANDRAIRAHICPNCQSTNAGRWGFKSGVQLTAPQALDEAIFRRGDKVFTQLPRLASHD